MSYDLSVSLPRSKMLTPAAWHAAILRAGFPVELCLEFNVETHTGFLPAPVNGQASGFEFRARAIDADVAREMRLAPDFNFRVVFSCGRRPLESVSAFAAASVLAAETGGMLSDPQTDDAPEPSEAIAWAREQIAKIEA